MIMNQNFSTYDLGLATVLITLKYELLKLDRTNPKKVRFVFREVKGIEKAMVDYFSDKIKLPTLTLFNNQKTLKNRIYSDVGFYAFPKNNTQFSRIENNPERQESDKKAT